MGTLWSVRVAARALPPGLDRAIAALFEEIVAAMSQWRAASALSRFNRAAPGWVALPPDLLDVVAAGLDLADASGGAFDPTMGAASALWGFGAEPAPAAPPPPEAVAAAHARGGWRRLRLDRAGGRAFQPGGLALDLSGIAKGHAVDRLSALLLAHDLPDHLAEIGGELVGRGVAPDGQPWWVAVEPPPGAALPPTRIALHGLAVATTGHHRRFLAHGRHRFGHTLDPRTGAPVANGVAAVTVLHARCREADALATAIAVLGRDEGAAFAAHNGVAALLIAEDAHGFLETRTPAWVALEE